MGIGYALGMNEPARDDTARRTDWIRQTVVVLSVGIAVAGAIVGNGAFGGQPIAEAAGGALDNDATLVAPGGPGFLIWSVIYAGLIGYALWQVRSSAASDSRQRRIGWWAAASMILNAAWILAVQAGSLVLSCIVIGMLVAVLTVIYVRTTDAPTSRTGGAGWVERILVDGVFGLYLGWVCVATIANIAATLVDADIVPLGLDPDAWAVAVLVLAGAIGAGLAVRGRGRVSAALGLGWGLVWIAAERLYGQPESVSTAVTAIAATAGTAVVVVIVAAKSSGDTVPSA